jgi:hypothetical protein
MKICTFNDFFSLFYQCTFSWFKVDQNFTVHSFEQGELRSVHISKLLCMVPEFQAFIFLTVCASSGCNDIF